MIINRYSVELVLLNEFKGDILKLQLKSDEKVNFQRMMREIGKTRNVLKPKLFAECSITPDDQYQRVNMFWYRLFDEHYEVFLKLIKDNNVSSAFVLGRTLLELYARSFYMEFIEKPKQTEVKDYLGDDFKIKQFAQMCNELDAFEHEDFGTFKKHFEQYKQTGLAIYSKLSFFSHGRGYAIKQFYKNPKAGYAFLTVAEAINIIHSMYLMLSLLLLFVQKKSEHIPLITDKFVNFQGLMVDIKVVQIEDLLKE